MANQESIEKLRGGENFHTWKFAMQNILEYNDLEKTITDPVTEVDAAKLRKAKSKIVLSIDESLYVHIQNETSASDIWKKLEGLYEDNGLSRKIGQFGAEIDECFKNEHILIACDNQSAIKLAETNCFRSRSKHIEVRHHHIRDRINDGTIAVRYISTEEMAADNLTKAVPSNKHQLCVNKMGLNIKN